MAMSSGNSHWSYWLLATCCRTLHSNHLCRLLSVYNQNLAQLADSSSSIWICRSLFLSRINRLHPASSSPHYKIQTRWRVFRNYMQDYKRSIFRSRANIGTLYLCGLPYACNVLIIASLISRPKEIENLGIKCNELNFFIDQKLLIFLYMGISIISKSDFIMC